jgi:ABC-type transport system involved in multi-copper enzyme maturation permease subunit
VRVSPKETGESVTALLRTELRRCWSRRAVHLFGLLALAGIALAAVLVFLNSAKPGNGFNVVDIKNVFEGVSAPLTILGIALAASFMGAEWSAGTMTTLLTWEPRRGRIFVAKLVAAAIFTFVSAMLLQTVLGLALLPSALAHGSSAGANAHWFWSAAGSAARGALVAVLGAGIGLGVASLARNTTAAVLGAMFYLFVFENIVQGLKPQYSGWLFSENAGIFIVGPKAASDSGNGITIGHSSVQALLVMSTYAAVVTVIALAVFLRRDVT